jgi:hypothetical protein
VTLPRREDSPLVDAGARQWPRQRDSRQAGQPESLLTCQLQMPSVPPLEPSGRPYVGLAVLAFDPNFGR